MRAISIALWWCLFAMPISAQVTLKDFNEPMPSDPFLDSVLAAHVDPAGMVELIISNEDCELGFSDKELTSLIRIVGMWAKNSVEPGQQISSTYDIPFRSYLWKSQWDIAAYAAQLSLCDPVRQVVEQIR